MISFLLGKLFYHCYTGLDFKLILWSSSLVFDLNKRENNIKNNSNFGIKVITLLNDNI